MTQPYFMVHFPWDVKSYDTCNTTVDCVDFYTKKHNNNVSSLLLTNKKFALEFTDAFNYCFLCNINLDNEFISNGIYINTSKIREQIRTRCNGKNGFVYRHFFGRNTYYMREYQANKTESDDITHFVDNLFTQNKIPVLCDCETTVERFAYRCNDEYHNFLVPFKKAFLSCFFMIGLCIYIFLDLIYLIIPYCNVLRENTKTRFGLAKSMGGYGLAKVCKILLDVLILEDLSLVIIFFKEMCVIFVFIDNLMQEIWNFNAVNEILDPMWYGIGKTFGASCLSCAICALIVKWSHVVHLIRSKDNKKTLSNKNIVLLLFVMSGNVILILTGLILSLAYYQSDYLFAFVTGSMVLIPCVMAIIFTIYGFIICHKLKSGGTHNIFAMKFTKAIIFFNIGVIFTITIAFTTLPTLITSFDTYGVFFALFRDNIIDSAAIVATIPMSYILFKPENVKKVYGGYLMCCKKNDTAVLETPRVPETPRSVI